MPVSSHPQSGCSSEPPLPASRCDRITEVRHEGNATTCVLTGAGTICVSPFMGGFLRPGDEIEFSSEFTAPVAKEVRVTRAGGRRPSELYSAPIAYVTQPRQDKRQELFLHAEVASGALGIRTFTFRLQRSGTTSTKVIVTSRGIVHPLCTNFSRSLPPHFPAIWGWRTS